MNSLVTLLRTMFPDTQIAPGTEPNQLAILARPAEHEKIKAAVTELDKDEPAETAPRITIYSVEVPGPRGTASVMSILQSMFPSAQFSLGTEAGKLVVMARPDEHKRIQAAVDEMAEKEPPETAPRFATYTVDAGRRGASTTLIALLSEQYPNARFSQGLERGHILAWARPDEHKRIQATLDELTKNAPPPELGYQLTTYTLATGNAAAVSNATSILRSMFPDAFFSAGNESGKLVAWARPADHPRIARIVDEVGKPEPPETAPRVQVYTFQSMAKGPAGSRSVNSLVTLLRTMFPDTQVAPGTEPNQVAILARPAEHEKIKVAVAEIDKDEPAEIAPRITIYNVEVPGPAAPPA